MTKMLTTSSVGIPDSLTLSYLVQKLEQYSISFVISECLKTSVGIPSDPVVLSFSSCVPTSPPDGIRNEEVNDVSLLLLLCTWPHFPPDWIPNEWITTRLDSKWINRQPDWIRNSNQNRRIRLEMNEKRYTIFWSGRAIQVIEFAQFDHDRWSTMAKRWKAESSRQRQE